MCIYVKDCWTQNSSLNFAPHRCASEHSVSHRSVTFATGCAAVILVVDVPTAPASSGRDHNLILSIYWTVYPHPTWTRWYFVCVSRLRDDNKLGCWTVPLPTTWSSTISTPVHSHSRCRSLVRLVQWEHAVACYLSVLAAAPHVPIRTPRLSELSNTCVRYSTDSYSDRLTLSCVCNGRHRSPLISRCDTAPGKLYITSLRSSCSI